jgi:putative flippase GtrA
MRSALSRVLTAERVALAARLLRFGVVGGCGWVVDTATVYAIKGLIGVQAAGIPAYVTAATCTWALNRVWTFRGRGGGGPMHRQWATFLATNLVGFAANRGAYELLVSFSDLCAADPIIATAAGALAGMVPNYILSSRIVFR